MTKTDALWLVTRLGGVNAVFGMAAQIDKLQARVAKLESQADAKGADKADPGK